MYTLLLSMGQLPKSRRRASLMTSSFCTRVPSISLPTITLKYLAILKCSRIRFTNSSGLLEATAMYIPLEFRASSICGMPS